MILDNNRRRSQIILSFLVITFSLITKSSNGARDRGARCEKPDYIPNGSYRIRRDRVMRITCNTGYVLQGSKALDCVRGKWDGDKPVCAKKGCKKDIEQPENGRIQIENDVKAILYCSDNYNLAGNRHSYCNGTQWDRPIGNCREHKNVVQHECDFETDDICGWTYEPREGLEWKRVMAANVFTTFKTGPRHDHTTLTANGGHYMLMESLTRHDDNVILTSPIYDRGMSLKTACCFQFYYFMYGAGVGDLFVVVKPVSLDLDDVFKNHKDFIKFQKYGNQNNIWNEDHFNIEELDEDFQILFVAKSGRGQLSDIAIDDVKLLTGDDCKVLDNKDDEDMSNEEYDSTTYESIFEMQSCVGHCFESPGSGLIRTLGHLKGLCNCGIDCEDNETCCPDFRTACLSELFEQSTPLSEADKAPQKNSTTISQETTTSAAVNTTSKTTTQSTPTSIINLITTKKSTPFIVRTTSTTTKAPVTTPPTTSLHTPKPLTDKTTKTTTMRLTPTTAISIKTIPATVTSKTTTTTKRSTTTSTTTTPKTTPTMTTKLTPTTQKTTLTTVQKTTPTMPAKTTTMLITTRKVTSKSTQITTTTLKLPTSTTPTKTTATTQSTTTVNTSPKANSRKRPIPTSKPIEYPINEKSKTQTSNRSFSSLLLYAFFIILLLILAGAAYKRFGDRAVAWYMIRFNTRGDEASSSIITSFKQPQLTKTTTKHSNPKKSRNAKSIMNARLINDDDDDDCNYDDIGVNGNIALKNNIYSEL